jgi:hypothetical protein
LNDSRLEEMKIELVQQQEKLMADIKVCYLFSSQTLVVVKLPKMVKEGVSIFSSFALTPLF